MHQPSSLLVPLLVLSSRWIFWTAQPAVPFIPLVGAVVVPTAISPVISALTNPSFIDVELISGEIIATPLGAPEIPLDFRQRDTKHKIVPAHGKRGRGDCWEKGCKSQSQYQCSCEKRYCCPITTYTRKTTILLLRSCRQAVYQIRPCKP